MTNRKVYVSSEDKVHVTAGMLYKYDSFLKKTGSGLCKTFVEAGLLSSFG